MKLSGILLSFYIMLLSVLPGIQIARKVSLKESCGHCCRQKPTNAERGQEREKPVPANPFYGCSVCTQAMLSEYTFQIKREQKRIQLEYPNSAKSYITPLFDFWHPPKRFM